MISRRDFHRDRLSILDGSRSSERHGEENAPRHPTIIEQPVRMNGKPRGPAKPSAASRILGWLVWPYGLGVVAVWLLLWQGGDRWWFATLMLFGPRWIYGLPLIALVPAALKVRRRLLLPLALSAGVVAEPIMGFCLPWQTLGRSDEPTLRVLSWNVQEHAADTATLAALIAATNPDVVALQECCPNCEQPTWPAGWHVHRQGHLVTASHYPIETVEFSQRRWPPSEWPPTNGLRCVIQTPNHRIGFVNIHLRTPREGLSAVLSRRTLVSPSKSAALLEEIEYRRLESEELQAWISQFPGPLVIAGDFNMPADSAIYRRTWSKYTDAFSAAGCGFGHTKHTQVLGLTYGARIDHILAGPGWRPCRAWTGPDSGSDHLPLLADLVWTDLAPSSVRATASEPLPSQGEIR
jgi:endonuclease/exonuclease/phosphatase (EEP) superfamily protein YafD